jgi:plastocyanin
MFDFGRYPRLSLAVLLSLVAADIGVGLLIAASAWAATNQVKISNFTFGPNPITISPGDTVTWINGDDIPHNVRATGGGTWKCAVMDTDGTCDITFKVAGEFTYFCALHPKMTGKVIVKTDKTE